MRKQTEAQNGSVIFPGVTLFARVRRVASRLPVFSPSHEGTHFQAGDTGAEEGEARLCSLPGACPELTLQGFLLLRVGTGQP